MPLEFVGKDPGSEHGDSPTVWVDADGSFVFQGWKLDEATRAEIGAIPSHEGVVRLPARMASIIRKAVERGDSIAG